MPLDPRFEIGPGQTMMASSAGSTITALSLTPLEVVKTRLQSNYTHSKKCYLFCNGLMQHLFPMRTDSKGLNAKPNGALEAFVQITRYEGFRSLWSGLGPTLVSALPSTVFYFVMYETLRKHMLRTYHAYSELKTAGSVPVWIPLTAGFLARSIALVLTTPVEVVRIKKQASKTTYREIFSQMRNSLVSDGVLSIWRPLPAAMLRDCPFSGIYWMCYEFMKLHFLTEPHPTFLFTMTAGAASGAIAATVTTPMDVVTTLTTIELGDNFIYSDAIQQQHRGPHPTSITKRLFHIYSNEGVRGMFAGLYPRLLRVPIACATMISIYEFSKHWFYNYNEKYYKS